MVTIKQVAELAGVSFKTVSRVLNDDPGVSQKLRERVLSAATQLDYKPNFAARHMRTQQSQTIGFITDEIAITPFAVNIVKGAQDYAWAHNKLLFVINTEANPERDQAAIDTMLERRVEGIIYAAEYHKPIRPPESIRKLPVVLLDCFVEDRSLPSVVPNEIGGGYNATEVLLQKGHRRISFINFSLEPAAGTGRLEGYRRALAAYDVPFRPEYIRYGNWRPNQAYDNTRAVMNLPEPPTAIFCANDWSALGVYDALRDLQLRIPEDVAVMGFDNEEMLTIYMRPALSSMALPHYQMGEWAVKYLMEQSGTYLSNPVQHQIDCPYIERGSTAFNRN